jgi:uncharacterized membrane protein YedE/YeeE
MKTPTPDELLTYARAQVRRADSVRPIMILNGVLILILVVLLIMMLDEKSEALGEYLPLNEHFLLGMAFGVMVFMVATIGGLCLVGPLRKLKGIEHHALKRLIELEEEGTENKNLEHVSDSANAV